MFYGLGFFNLPETNQEGSLSR